MFCSISGNSCVEPVLAVPSGFVFERATIEKHLSSQSTCPISGVALSKSDLVNIRTPENFVVPFRIPANSSIPSLLRSLQAEYDSIILDSHELKVENSRLKQELCTALYQHDAACRVISRLIDEGKVVRAADALLRQRVKTNNPLLSESLKNVPEFDPLYATELNFQNKPSSKNVGNNVSPRGYSESSHLLSERNFTNKFSHNNIVAPAIPLKKQRDFETDVEMANTGVPPKRANTGRNSPPFSNAQSHPEKRAPKQANSITDHEIRIQTKNEVYAASPISAPVPTGDNFLVPANSQFDSLNFRTKFAEEIKKAGEVLSGSRRNRKSSKVPPPTDFGKMQLANTLETPYMGISSVKALHVSCDKVLYLICAGKTRGSTLFTYDTMLQNSSWPVKQSKISHISILSPDSTNPTFLLARKDSVALSSTTEIIASYPVDEAITGLCAHPSGSFFALLSANNTVSIYSIDYEIPLYQLRNLPPTIRTIGFHPDGLLLAVVSGSSVHIYSVVSGEVPAILEPPSPESPPISLISFSENGFHFACASEGGEIRIWDLRRLVINTVLKLPTAPSAMTFDFTGMFLAAAYPHPVVEGTVVVSLYNFSAKQWRQMPQACFECPNFYPVSDLAWGPSSRSIIISGSESKRLYILSIDTEVEDEARVVVKGDVEVEPEPEPEPEPETKPELVAKVVVEAGMEIPSFQSTQSPQRGQKNSLPENAV